MFRRPFLLFLLIMFLIPQITLAGSLSTSNSSLTVPTINEKPAITNDDVLPKIELTNVRWLVNQDTATGADRLRLVIDTTGPVAVSSKLDDTKSQVVIDIAGATVGNIATSLPLDGNIADQASFTTISNCSSRVIVSLDGIVNDSDYTVFTLPSDSSAGKPFRVVIDMNKPLPQGEYTFTPGLQNKVIVIDPGHGGSDTGAIGPNKTQEKTITLAVAQKVQTLLEKAGAQVIMTREADNDVFAPNDSAVDELRARTLVGNDNNAAVFLSIHINACPNPAVGGTATYYYPKTKYDVLLAKCIQDNIAPAGGLQNRGRRPANFYVMKHTQMPAILTELAFISNPTEEQTINSVQFQQQMAQGIVQGLDSFFTLATKKASSL